MRLGLSNLAFAGTPTAAELERLAAYGFTGIEVAPGRFGPWCELTDARLAVARREFAAVGFSVPSLQAIFFGADGVALLGDAEAFERMAAHVDLVGRVGAALGAGVAVFGAPRQRSRGGLGEEEAFALGVVRLSRLAEIAAGHGVTLGLEPVPSAYSGDFVPHWRGVAAMVAAVSSPGLSIHLDTSCVELGGDDVAEAVRACVGLRHFHAAEPELRGFEAPVADHRAAAAALRETGYDGWVVAEMLADKAAGDDPVGTAAAYVAGVYGG